VARKNCSVLLWAEALCLTNQWNLCVTSPGLSFVIRREAARLQPRVNINIKSDQAIFSLVIIMHLPWCEFWKSSDTSTNVDPHELFNFFTFVTRNGTERWTDDHSRYNLLQEEFRFFRYRINLVFVVGKSHIYLSLDFWHTYRMPLVLSTRNPRLYASTKKTQSIIHSGLRIPFFLKLTFSMQQIDSMLPCVCSVIDHRWRENVRINKVAHEAIAECVADVFTIFWRLFWSVTEQTHGNMESALFKICFIKS